MDEVECAAEAPAGVRPPAPTAPPPPPPDPFQEPLALLAQAREAEERGAAAEAAAWYERALAAFGPACEHPLAGVASVRLGLQHAVADRFAEAEPLLRRGLALLCEQGGAEEKWLARTAFAGLMEIYVDRNSRADIEALSRSHPALLSDYVESSG